ncbi:hypothetical protein POVWA2_034590 [Plasmodium ovale wallikeri]|uniref:ER membrane protein complex subunit 3 n=1 Tax=Plasmodium ovale wallikeri TaxID=864142 RepID=A0A1A8Z1S5_PLAOA|nr:hypothetical protein POVWA2_034590 [Plasmodium ovale wallikeri]
MDVEKLRQKFTQLKINHGFISPVAFLSRKYFFNKPQVGFFNDMPEQANPFDTLLKQDPSDLFGMVKNQIPFLVLQLGLGFLINLFFSGYLVGTFYMPSHSNVGSYSGLYARILIYIRAQNRTHVHDVCSLFQQKYPFR